MRFVGRNGRRRNADEHRRVRFATRVVADADLRGAGECRHGDGREQRSHRQDQTGADGTSAE
jgi:hypothetical protein